MEAAHGLLRLGDLRAVSVCAAALRDEEGSVRFEAAKALEKFGNRCVVADLVRVLDDEYEHVRRTAARALTVIATRDPVPELRAALPVLVRLTRSDKGRAYRRAMQQIITSTEATRAIPLASQKPDVSRAMLPIPAETGNVRLSDLPVASQHQFGEV
jgi:HEAT repeat protein